MLYNDNSKKQKGADVMLQAYQKYIIDCKRFIDLQPKLKVTIYKQITFTMLCLMQGGASWQDLQNINIKTL